MKDNYGDPVTVRVINDDGLVVRLAVESGDDAFAAHHYTPAKARKLAKKLRAAADEAERDA